MRTSISSDGTGVRIVGLESGGARAPSEAAGAAGSGDAIVPSSTHGIYFGVPDTRPAQIEPRGFGPTIQAVEARLREALRASTPHVHPRLRDIISNPWRRDIRPANTPALEWRVLGLQQSYAAGQAPFGMFIPGDPPYGEAWAEMAVREGVYFTLPLSLASYADVSDDDDERTQAFLGALVGYIEELNRAMARFAANGASPEQLSTLAREVMAVRGNFYETRHEGAINMGSLEQASGRDLFGFMMYALSSRRTARMLFNSRMDDRSVEWNSAAGRMVGAAALEILKEAASDLGLEQFPDEDQMVADANIALLTLLRETALDRRGWSDQERADFDAYMDRIRHDLQNDLGALRSGLERSSRTSEPGGGDGPGARRGGAS